MALDRNKFAKGVTRRNDEYECTIRLNVSDKATGTMSLVFSFYDGAEKKFTNGSDYILFTTNDDCDRVYFFDSNPINGYKIIQNNKTGSYAMRMQRRIKGKEIDFWRANIGDYNLLFDKAERLYYIDLNYKA